MSFPPSLKKWDLFPPFIMLILLWIADTADEVMVFRAAFSFDSGRDLLHVWIYVGQLLCLIFVGRALLRVRSLNESLDAARTEAEEAKGRIETIMEAMVDPVSVQDPNFTILFQNLAHRQMMGDQAGRKCYEAYMGRKDVCDECHLLKPLREGVAHRREVKAPGDAVKYLEIVASPIKDSSGRAVSAIEVIRDVTTRKAQEEEIRKLNEDLERQTRTLKSTCKELEAFSYSASHDLRIPLTRIYSAAQILEDVHDGQLGENGSFLVHTICDACEHMEELIDALLMLSQVAISQIKLEPVDLASVSREVISDLRRTYPDRTVKFEAPPDLWATGDSKLLRVLLENLLNNAWKYTGKVPEGWIHLSVTTHDGKPVYCIRDNGAGFSMKDAARLFKPFNRLHRADEFPGTGVGLATVERIVQRHGGNIRAEGEPGKGAAFYFTLS